MSWPDVVIKTLKQLDLIESDLNNIFVGRERAIKLLILAALTREHLLLIGPPGTAKTRIINEFCELIEARGFTYLISRFTEPAELFGPLDLAEFQQGNYHIRTERMLPEAEIGFLDEVFQGSSPILNALLTIVNERIFHNGSQRQKVPLVTLIGAANTLPEDPWLQAFTDRFLLRLEVAAIEDKQVGQLLEYGWELEKGDIQRAAHNGNAPAQVARISMNDLVALHARLPEVDISRVEPRLARMIHELRAEGVLLSDRRVVKALKLIAGAALLRRVDKATEADLWPLQHMWNRMGEAETLQRILHQHMVEAGIDAPSIAPSLEEIIADRNILSEEEAAGLRTEAAIHAHLGELNHLRKQLIQYYPKNKEERRRIESDIERVMNELRSNQNV